MNLVHIDFESFSHADLKKVGAYHYAQHPSTELLCACYAINDGPVRTWLPGDDNPFHKVNKWEWAAHNAQFEMVVWRWVCTRLYGWDMPPSLFRWHDTAAEARHYGLPGALEAAANALDLGYRKDKTGHRIMLKLSRPRKPSANNPENRWTPETKPDDFAALYRYCKTDVLVEREIHSKLGKLPSQELRLWRHNEKVNRRGLPVDVKLAKRVIKIKEYHQVLGNARLAEITDGEITKISQVQKLNKYLDIPSIGQEFLLNRVRSDYSDLHNEIMDLRDKGSQSSTAKYDSIVAANIDGYMYGMFMYHTANQTGRYGGALMQPHNIPRPLLNDDEIELAVSMILKAKNIDTAFTLLIEEFGDVMKVLKSIIRATIKAPHGYKFIVSDFTGVEVKWLAMIANCTYLLNMYHEGRNPYLEMAKSLYQRNVDKHDDPVEYVISKQLILAAGYGMGGPGFVGHCHGWGVEVDPQFAARAIKTYRTDFKPIIDLWYAVNRTVIQVVETGQPKFAAMCRFSISHKPFHRLVCTLPGGKEMSYPYPKVDWDYPPWETDTKIKQFSFATVDQKTYSWIRSRTWGARIVGNICQAGCREVLAERMMKLESMGYQMCGHVHDEVMILTRNSEAKRNLKIVNDVMSTTSAGWPNLLLQAESFIDQRYKK